jgi:hypothetical protein
LRLRVRSNFGNCFRKRCADLVTSQIIRYEFRSDHGQASRLPGLATDLVRLKVDLIVTRFTPAAKAAKQPTREAPAFLDRADEVIE